MALGGAAPLGGRPTPVSAALLRRGMDAWPAEGAEDERGMGPLPLEIRTLRLKSTPDGTCIRAMAEA